MVPQLAQVTSDVIERALDYMRCITRLSLIPTADQARLRADKLRYLRRAKERFFTAADTIRDIVGLDDLRRRRAMPDGMKRQVCALTR